MDDVTACLSQHADRGLTVLGRRHPVVLSNHAGQFSGFADFQYLGVYDHPLAFPLGPPIQTVDVPKGHPQTAVVRVIVRFSWNGRIQWIASCHPVPIPSMDRPQHGLRTGSEVITGDQLAFTQKINSVGLLHGLVNP